MIISFDFGHMEGGQDTSANGVLYEYRVNRDYGQVVVDVLRNAGHTLKNCTPADGSCSSVMESLAYRVNKANASGSSLHLCFHANCYNGNAHGAEVEVASSSSATYGLAILNQIVALGFTNRGVNQPSLYVTKHTNMACVLIEPFFVDNQSDCNLYNPTTLGNAIAKGILSVIGGNYNPSNVSIPQSIQQSTSQPMNSSISELQANLNSLINAKLDVDGITGTNTQNAVKNFQKLMGLSIDGIAGTNTLSAINEIKDRPLCKIGSKGYAVRWIQWRIGSSVDGIFGNGTATNVKNFQSSCGLSADGIVGANTWITMFK